MRILRVFPQRTSFTPKDEDVRIGRGVQMFDIDKYDEVHISCTFSYDLDRAYQMLEDYKMFDQPVKLGGAYFGSRGAFIPGRYVAKGITITSRGCNNSCWFCAVPKKEGMIQCINIEDGHIIQDNNILQCPEKHLDAVFQMLKDQKRNIFFKGGLQPSLITQDVVDRLKSVPIGEVWLSLDKKSDIPHFQKAARLLHWIPENKRRVYILTDQKHPWGERYHVALKAGFTPFVATFVPLEAKTRPKSARELMRPCLIKALTAA